jgi:hypothetical protein
VCCHLCQMKVQINWQLIHLELQLTGTLKNELSYAHCIHLKSHLKSSRTWYWPDCAIYKSPTVIKGSSFQMNGFCITFQMLIVQLGLLKVDEQVIPVLVYDIHHFICYHTTLRLWSEYRPLHFPPLTYKLLVY